MIIILIAAVAILLVLLVFCKMQKRKNLSDQELSDHTQEIKTAYDNLVAAASRMPDTVSVNITDRFYSISLKKGSSGAGLVVRQTNFYKALL